VYLQRGGGNDCVYTEWRHLHTLYSVVLSAFGDRHSITNDVE